MAQLIDPHPHPHPDPDRLGKQYYTAWQLITTYWQSSFKYPAYFFLSFVFLLTVLLVGFDIAFSYWYNYFYDALQAYDAHGAFRLVVIFFGLAIIYVMMAVYRFYVSQIFSLRWRKWLTERFIARWLQNRTYYLLEQFDSRTDNPDQRIQEDVGALVNTSMDLAMGLISAITTFIAFSYILWQLSGGMSLSLGPLGVWHLQGYLVIVGVLYALIGTLLTIKLGRPLIGLNFEQQRLEANFRYQAVDLRKHAEHVALYHSESQQQGVLGRLFNRVFNNYYAIIMRQKTLLYFTAGYNQVAVILPLLVVLPNYFEKVFLLGGLMQSLRAFTQLQDSLSFLINSYTRIAEWNAVTKRLTTFVNHMHDAESKASEFHELTISSTQASKVVLQNITLMKPSHEILLANISHTFLSGQRYLINGSSGLGKSTLIRTIAGVWPYAKGTILLPLHEEILYLPQLPYMPIGTLYAALSFPREPEAVSLDEVKRLLRDCRLEHLIKWVHQEAIWSQRLSPGEQQRITLARVLLSKPDWVFFDESTSMLDLQNENYFYTLLAERLPNLSIVSVGHRVSLQDYHQQVINLNEFFPKAVVKSP